MSGLLTSSRLRAVERIGVGLYVVVAVILLGREITTTVVGRANPAPSSTVATASRSTTPPSVSAPAISPTPTVVVTVPPTPSASLTQDALVVAAYQNGGRRFAALVVPVGYTVTSPISGTAGVVLYQFLGGDVRIGSNVPSEPFFPYITITSADRTVILRPGALDRDVQLIVKDGQTVAAGTPLFRVAAAGASSWRTFYDQTVTAQVIASVAALPSRAELDPVPFFKR